jgi:hypothetical protein
MSYKCAKLDVIFLFVFIACTEVGNERASGLLSHSTIGEQRVDLNYDASKLRYLY